MKICMPPAEALRRYAPWRTGQPGERQGKHWLSLPFWGVMFLPNMVLALIWWCICKGFSIEPSMPPPEVMEGETRFGRSG